MTKIKLCGISRMIDIEAINQLQPEYIGFVFAPNSKRYISDEWAEELKRAVKRDIQVVGVFVDESVQRVAKLLNENIIDIAQLHGNEDEEYICSLRKLSQKPIIKAFQIEKESDIAAAERSCADYVLLDSGAGCGECFDWNWVKAMNRPFFLAGGLHELNVQSAIMATHPFAVDVSSGIETNGIKDNEKMATFVAAVREIDKKGQN